MKVRLLSDLHLNRNNNKYLPIYKNDNVLTIIAGDVSNDINMTKTWLENNFKNVIFIEGNHIATSDNNKYSLKKLYSKYKKTFPINSNYCFLQNNYKVIDDYVFVGCTLWTDFSFVNTNNDNPWQTAIDYFDHSPTGKTFFRNWLGKKCHAHPKYFKKEFNKSIKFLKKTFKKFHDKKIFLIIHHPPSPQAIVKKYADWKYLSTTIVDIEPLIKNNPQIKYILHGHVHQSWNYNIGSTKVYCNPLGVEDENPQFKKDLIIEI